MSYLIRSRCWIPLVTVLGLLLSFNRLDCQEISVEDAKALQPKLVMNVGHAAPISSLVVSSDGKLLMSVACDSIIVWSIASRQQIAAIPGAPNLCFDRAIFGTTSKVLFLRDDNTLLLWDLARPDSWLPAFNLEKPIAAIAFSARVGIIASASDGQITFWNPESRAIQKRIDASQYGSLFALASSHDGRYLVSAHLSSYKDSDELTHLVLWDALTGICLHETTINRTDIQGIAFVEESTSVALGTSKLAAVVRPENSVPTSMPEIFDQSIPDLSSLLDHHGRAYVGIGLRAVWFPSDSVTLNAEPIPSQSKTHYYLPAGITPDFTKVFYSENSRVMVIKVCDVSSGVLQSSFRSVADPIEDLSVAPTGIAVLNSAGSLRIWDLYAGREQSRTPYSLIDQARISDAGNEMTIVRGDEVRQWNLDEDEPKASSWRLPAKRNSFGVSQNGRWLVYLSDRQALIRQIDGVSVPTSFSLPEELKSRTVRYLAVSADGRLAVVVYDPSQDIDASYWDGIVLQKLHPTTPIRIKSQFPIGKAKFSPDGRFLLTSGPMNIDKYVTSNIQLWDLRSSQPVRQIPVSPELISPPVELFGGFSRGLDILYGDSNRVYLASAEPGKKATELSGHFGLVTAIATFQNGSKIITSGRDGTVRIWERTGKQLATIVSRDIVEDISKDASHRDKIAALYGLGGAVVSGGGAPRFDLEQIENLDGMSWVFPDDSLRPLPAEIFMRDYYEPRLLARLWTGEKFKEVRPLASLNRVQPTVEAKAEWKDETAGIANVVVKVGRNQDPEMRNGKTATAPFDLRVFRDGQLVRYAPETSVEWQFERPATGKNAEELDLKQWRKKTEIKDLDLDGTKEFTFPVQVSRRADLKEVTFTAYAFNEDRVKSTTASVTLKIKKPLEVRQPKAYVISVGVNRTESPAWDLQYAANDARQMSQVVGDKLEGTEQFARVVRVRLVSAEKKEPKEAAATKVHVQAVLDMLAGRRTVDEQLKKEIPGIDEVEKAQPEDLVLLAFSSHGYTDDHGVFHIVLADIGANTPREITPELDRETLSSDELSGWLRDVDAGEMVMVVDSCHSAATVEAEGFKPGPMGSRGLGQMAYDKGMRILAASKSEQSAVERDGIKHGLLSYALVDEGLMQGLADFQPKDGKILMSEWLAYGEQEVPKLFREGDSKGIIQRKGGPDTAKDGYHGSKQTPPRYQQPVLFDFTKHQVDVALVIQ